MEEIASNGTTNSTFDEDDIYYNASFFERVCIEVFTVIAICSLIANILLITVIAKYRKLRRDVTNVLILNLNVVQACYLFFAPITWRAVFLLPYSWAMTLTFCIINELEGVIMISNCLVLILLVWDWYLKTYFKEKYRKFVNVHRFLLILVYVVAVLFTAILIQFCIKKTYIGLTLIAVAACYLFTIVFLVVMNIIHRVKVRKLTNKPPNHVGLAITNVFVLAWCPAMLMVIISIFYNSLHPVAFIVAVAFGFSSPIGNLVYLFRYDNHYNVFLKKLFRCQCSDYENEELIDDCSVTYSNNGVQIVE